MDQGCCTDQEWKGVWDPFVRLCYQFGMLLGVDEFNQDLGYGLCKHRLSQRLFVGWGLAWGGAFTVDDGKGQVSVPPLFALDELGREVYQPDTCTLDLAQFLDDNGLNAGATVYLTIEYQACCVGPVPAVAAPCDDAASPTMMSRVLERAVCRLSQTPPPDALDLSADVGPQTQAATFATLLQMIRDDAARPILLGTLTTQKATAAGQKTTTTIVRNGALPPLTIAGAPLLRVSSVAIVPDAGGKAHLDVTFSIMPDVAPLAAFQVLEVIPPASPGALSTVESRVAAGATVTAEPAKNVVHVPLDHPPASGHGYRVTVAGTGPQPVLKVTPNGPVALGDGNDYFYAAVQG